VGGYDHSQIGKSQYCLSVGQSVGRSVGRNQLKVISKAVSKKRKKESILVGPNI